VTAAGGHDVNPVSTSALAMPAVAFETVGSWSSHAQMPAPSGPVVDHDQPLGQGLGLGGAGCVREVEKERAHPAPVLLGRLLDGLARVRLRAGAHERATAEVRLGEQLPLHLEDADQPLAGSAVAGLELSGQPLAGLGVAALEVGADQGVLAAIRVDRAAAPRTPKPAPKPAPSHGSCVTSA
jgi:hypothetical protein